MAKIIGTVERDCCTWFLLDDGKHVEAEYGYSIGNEVGIHSHTGSRTDLRLVEGHDLNPDGMCIEKVGFDCSEDNKEGEYDWSVWETELVDYMRRLGWVDVE